MILVFLNMFLHQSTHPNVRHSLYSILRVLMGAARLMKLRLGVLTGAAGQRGRLALRATRAPQEPKCLREGHDIAFDQLVGKKMLCQFRVLTVYSLYVL